MQNCEDCQGWRMMWGMCFVWNLFCMMWKKKKRSFICITIARNWLLHLVSLTQFWYSSPNKKESGRLWRLPHLHKVHFKIVGRAIKIVHYKCGKRWWTLVMPHATQHKNDKTQFLLHHTNHIWVFPTCNLWITQAYTWIAHHMFGYARKQLPYMTITSKAFNWLAIPLSAMENETCI